MDNVVESAEHRPEGLSVCRCRGPGRKPFTAKRRAHLSGAALDHSQLPIELAKLALRPYCLSGPSQHLCILHVARQELKGPFYGALLFFDQRVLLVAWSYYFDS